MGYFPENKFGRATNVDDGILTDIWDGANATDDQDVWLAPTAARIHTLVSSDDADSDSGGSNPQGAGMRTVRVDYLADWDTAEASETVILDGTAGVAMVAAAVMINRMEMLTCGASGPNVGKITATAATDSTISAMILATNGQTQMAVFGFPSIRKVHMGSLYASILRANLGVNEAQADIELCVNPIPDDQPTVFILKHSAMAGSRAMSPFQHRYDPGNPFDGPGIIKLRAAGSANNLTVSGGFSFFMVDV